jgi:hypothetical protein
MGALMLAAGVAAGVLLAVLTPAAARPCPGLAMTAQPAVIPPGGGPAFRGAAPGRCPVYITKR